MKYLLLVILLVGCGRDPGFDDKYRPRLSIEEVIKKMKLCTEAGFYPDVFHRPSDGLPYAVLCEPKNDSNGF